MPHGPSSGYRLLAPSRRTTDNRQPTTDNQQPTTDNQPPTTDNRQPTTNNQQPTTDNRQRTTDNHHPALLRHHPRILPVLLPAEITQEEGWIAAARRDPQAFAPLYLRYHKPIFLFVLKRVQDRDLCGDLTAQVFLKSMAALPKYEGRGLPFKAWLYRIALNEASGPSRG